MYRLGLLQVSERLLRRRCVVPNAADPLNNLALCRKQFLAASYVFFSLREALLDDRPLHASTLANRSASFSRLVFCPGFNRETEKLLR
jgi:hypothetical protein